MATKQKLLKKLSLFDVYAVSTGAMFSSGFFLLPGLAAFETGNSVYLAYLVAGILIVPSLFSVAELSTAMPRAGGAYYFLDRSLGPLMGTVGGLGSWLALIFKSAFALIGMGAYLTLFVEVPMLPLAVVLTIGFGLINIFGAKETAMLQRIMVAILVVVMLVFTIQGINYLYVNTDILPETKPGNFMTNGIEGFIYTIGLVFVSFAGLTKVASIAEEVKNPDKNIPLGMILSLITAVFVYVVGVYIMVKVIPADDFFKVLTPVSEAGAIIFDFIPENIAVIFIVIAAVAAFASTGNAGLMSASRYPLAMSRDKLVSPIFSRIGKYETPHYSVIITTAVMVVVLFLGVKSVAKLASAFQLLLFCLLNLAVIVMRESRIEAYKPGFKSPLYPYVQVVGMFVSLWLVAQMGYLAVGFVGTLVLLAVAWYFYYVHGRVKRQGAIFHVHARLGQKKDNAIERELMTIINEKNVRSSIIYQKIIARSIIVEHEKGEATNHLIARSEQLLAERLNVNADRLSDTLFNLEEKLIELREGVFFTYDQNNHCQVPEMLALHSKDGVPVVVDGEEKTAFALLFLVTPKSSHLLRMRIIGHMAELIEADDFVDNWRKVAGESPIRSLLLSEDRFVHIEVNKDQYFGKWAGQLVKEVDLPGESLITMIERRSGMVIPRGNTEIQEGDILFVLGYPSCIADLKKQINEGVTTG
jgi:amino acid transporter